MDRNGADLAVSVPRPTVFVDPAAVTRPHATAVRLAAILGQPAATIEAALTRTHTRYVVLLRQASPHVEAAVRALDNPGVALEPGTRRIMPNGDLAGPVIGFVNGSGTGGGGVEFGDNATLTGRAGRLDAERDPSGREIPATERKLRPAQAGRRHRPDPRPRAAVPGGAAADRRGRIREGEGRDGPHRRRAQRRHPRGSGRRRCRRPRSGAPAAPTEANRLFTTPYEPGSTNKVITIASTLESHTITPETRFDVPARIRVGGANFDDDEWHPESSWTIREILPDSSNVGTIKVAAKIGQSRLERSLREFGLGVRTAVGFPGESGGTLQAPDQGDPTIMGSLPIGYGVNATAAQMLGVYMTIANGGVTRPLRLVDGTVDAAGVRHRSRHAALSPCDLVRDRVDPQRAHARRRHARHRRAGRDPGLHGGGQDRHRRASSRTPSTATWRASPGFAPAEAPRYAAVVVLDEPKTQIYGGAVAAPVFSQIMQATLRQEHVAPTVALDTGAQAPG